MVKKTLQNVVELEENGVSIIRTIAVREKSYWNKGKCFGCPEDAAAFAKPGWKVTASQHGSSRNRNGESMFGRNAGSV